MKHEIKDTIVFLKRLGIVVCKASIPKHAVRNQDIQIVYFVFVGRTRGLKPFVGLTVGRIYFTFSLHFQNSAREQNQNLFFALGPKYLKDRSDVL